MRNKNVFLFNQLNLLYLSRLENNILNFNIQRVNFGGVAHNDVA